MPERIPLKDNFVGPARQKAWLYACSVREFAKMSFRSLGCPTYSNPRLGRTASFVFLLSLALPGVVFAQQPPPPAGRAALAVTVSPDVTGLEETAAILVTLTNRDRS